MKILLVTQYYWPENFKINLVAKGISENHDLTVLTGLPNYPEGEIYEGYKNKKVWISEQDGIKVIRCRLISRGKANAFRLALNYFSFAFFASIKLFQIKEEFDYIFVYQTSPVTVGIPAVFAKKRFRAKMLFWVQDLWPESLRGAGAVKNKIILGFFDLLTRFIYKRSDKILVQSEAFKPYIMNQKIESSKLEFFPNIDEPIKQVNSEYTNKFAYAFDNQSINILFAGNLGAVQGLEDVIKALKVVNEEKILCRLIILGDGRNKKNLLELSRKLDTQDYVYFLGKHSSDYMQEFFDRADALLISLRPHMLYDLTIPNKFQSYLSAGKPILGYIGGEVKRLIEEIECGLCASSHNANDFADTINTFINLSDSEKFMMGRVGKKYYNENFTLERLLERFEKLIR